MRLIALLLLALALPASAAPDLMRVLERFPLYSERGWHADYRNDRSLGYFGDKDHGEMGLRAMGNYVFVTSLLATDPAYDPRVSKVSRETLLARARACLAYMTRAHSTGDIPCADGKPWGDEWQSSWWTARMAAGARLLWPKLSAEERAAVERVIVHEADRHLNRKPPGRMSLDTKSEENAWDCEVLAWAAGMFPQHPHASAWMEKLKEFAMNSLSAPQDTTDSLPVDGKPVSQWVTTANIHTDFTIENHGAYHFCYMACPLHSLAWSCEGLKGAGAPVPDALFHHYQDVWRWVKRTYLGDGRFAYLSGKDWPRYAYGLSFVLPAAVMAQIRWADPDARRIELDRIALLEREQLLNGDGSFYGGRFTRDTFGGRLAEYETDTYANLALCYLLHKHHKIPIPTDPAKLQRYLSGSWFSEESGWAFGRSPKLFASFSWRHLGGYRPMGLFIPAGGADMAEWSAWQLVGRFDAEGLGRDAQAQHAEQRSPFGFSSTGQVEYQDAGKQPLLRQQISFTALPEEGIAVVLEHTVAAKAVSLRSAQGLNLPLANDIFNGSVRRIEAQGREINLPGAKNLTHAEMARKDSVSEKRIPVRSKWLCIDGRLGIAQLDGGEEFLLHDVSGRNAPSGSLQYELISADHQEARALKEGETALESAFLLVAGDGGRTARLQRHSSFGRADGLEGVRYAVVEAPSGRLFLVVANLDGRSRLARLSIPVEEPSRAIHYTADPIHRNGKWWLGVQVPFSGYGTEVREIGRRAR